MIGVKRISALDNEWRAFILKQSSDSLFCSPEFAELWRSMNGTPIYWTVTENDKPVALLPGVEFGATMLARFQAMPEGCYGRFLIDNRYRTDHERYWRELITHLTKRYTKAFLFDFFESMPSDPRLKMEQAETIVVDISGGQWEPPDKKERWAVRKAEKDGLAMVDFRAEKHFDDFMQLIIETEERHGRKPRYPRLFYQALANLSANDNRIRWVVCEAQNELVASHIYFVENKMLFYWQSFCSRQGMKSMANDFLLGNIAAQFSARGLEQLNLGASPVDAEGLKQFKLKWGGVEKRYPYYTHRSTLGKIF